MTSPRPRLVLTGATGGIGGALARRLANLDVQLLLLGTDTKRLRTLAGLGEHVDTLAVDLTDPQQIANVFTWIDEHWDGELEVLIHNAAAMVSGDSIEDTKLAEVRAGFEVGPIAGQQLVAGSAPRMKEGARVIFTSSGAAHTGFANLAAYSAAKFALRGLAEAAAAELAPRGITVSTVVLPTVRTALAERVFSEEVLASAPAPDEVLDPFFFLLSERGLGVAGPVALREQAVHSPLAAPLFHPQPSPRVPLIPRGRQDLLLAGMQEPIAKVDLGEPPFPPSPRVREAVDAWMRGEHTSDYPDGQCRHLRYKLSERYGISQDHFLCGPGSSIVLAWILDGLMQPGDEVLCADPCFALWPWLVRGRGLALKTVPSGETYHDLEGLLAAVGPRTRLIYLDSPGNPAGAVIHKDAFETFMRALPRHVFVVVDHAYRDFVTNDDALDATSIDTLWDPRVISVRTLSKTHALAGWRVGFAAAHPSTILALRGIVPPFALSSAAQVAAVAALDDEEHATRVREHFATERAYIQERLTVLGLPFHASETNFMSLPWPDVATGRAAAATVNIPIANTPDENMLVFAMRSREENDRVLAIIAEHHPGVRE